MCQSWLHTWHLIFLHFIFFIRGEGAEKKRERNIIYPLLCDIMLLSPDFFDRNLFLVRHRGWILRDSRWCSMAVVVRIQDYGSRTKPFLGGWRNTVTGLIYHNACTQTHNGGTRSRITQTVAVADTVTDVVHDQAVQVKAMQFLPDIRDRIIAPGIFSFGMPTSVKEVKSLSCQDYNKRILDSVVKIQKCYR